MILLLKYSAVMKCECFAQLSVAAALARKLFLLLFLCCHILTPPVSALHLSGQWEARSFYKFLTKFGFQQTRSNDKVETQGYIYGNITGTRNKGTKDAPRRDARVQLVVLDSEYFAGFFSKRTPPALNGTCSEMFRDVDRIAWDERCLPNGKEDFLRGVPCPLGRLCDEETSEGDVEEGFQFTYHVQDIYQPR